MNDGGPAFARATTLSPITAQPWNAEQKGMSLRDYFAAKAMHALLANAMRADFASMSAIQIAKLHAGVAPSAYEHADLMLKARAKQPAEA